MSHHNPRHPHRHHVRVPEPPKSDSGFSGMFWCIVAVMVALSALGYWLSV